MIAFRCPTCHHFHQVADELAGRLRVCSQCNAQLIIPHPVQAGDLVFDEPEPVRRYYREPRSGGFGNGFGTGCGIGCGIVAALAFIGIAVPIVLVL